MGDGCRLLQGAGLLLPLRCCSLRATRNGNTTVTWTDGIPDSTGLIRDTSSRETDRERETLSHTMPGNNRALRDRHLRLDDRGSRAGPGDGGQDLALIAASMMEGLAQSRWGPAA